MSTDEPTREEIEAAARRLWRDEHGFRCISSHDSKRTRESDEQEMDRAFRQWDRGAVSDPVKDGYRSKGRNALIAAREVRSEALAKRDVSDEEVEAGAEALRRDAGPSKASMERYRHDAGIVLAAALRVREER